MSAPAINNEQEDIQAGLPQIVWRIFGVFCVLALISLGIYAFGALYGDQMAKAGHSTDTTKLEIIVANDAYLIPGNMVRHADQRVGGSAKRIDAYVHWPTRSGYTTELSAEFTNSDPDSIELIFLTFNERNSLLDMAERFRPVYQNAIDASKIRTLSNGLYVAPLAAEYGYINERLLYSRADVSGQPPFVARCQAAPYKETRLLLPCETDIFVGATSEMRVRFPLTQLERWSEFASELNAFADGLITSN